MLANLREADTATWNLEVENEHVYRVGPAGILVHNTCPTPKELFEGGGAAKKPPNPYGSMGKPDHQAKVDELEAKARAEAGEGDTVLRERQLQGHDSRRKPDVQTVGPDGKATKVYEAERYPNRRRNLNREAEYDLLGLDHETHGLK